MNKIKIPETELTFTFSRSGGAGGQNVNKVNSKVTMYWDFKNTLACAYEVISRFKTKYGNFITDEGKVMIISQESRSQKANIDCCIDKLEAMLNSVLIAPIKRKKTKPTKSSVEKRIQGKKINSERKRNRKIDY